jgi:hypothetical protein
MISVVSATHTHTHAHILSPKKPFAITFIRKVSRCWWEKSLGIRLLAHSDNLLERLNFIIGNK